MYINLFKRINSKNKLNTSKITIFALYTPWETLEIFCFTLPHFPLHVYYSDIT